MEDPFLVGMTPAEIVEHLKDAMPDLSDADLEVDTNAFIFLQESMLLHIQKNRQNRNVTDSQASSQNMFIPQDRGSSNIMGLDSMALDEAYARSLELEELFDGLDISSPEHVGSIIDNREQASSRTPPMNENFHMRQDDIDPDRMTYEELQSLGESIGNENKGLPSDLIAQLPTFKYNTGLFSRRKKEKEECVICCAEYKNRTKLIVLPCAHHYHSKCITQWLTMNKNCPVCQKEVQEG